MVKQRRMHEKDLEIKKKIRGTGYAVVAVGASILMLMAKVMKENVFNKQQTVPIIFESSGSQKKFVSVEIMQGDTLWSIAEDNKTGNYTTKELVEKIKHTNGLNGDKIIAGRYLLVPYYD